MDRIASEIQRRTEDAEKANEEMTKAARELAKIATLFKNAVAEYRV